MSIRLRKYGSQPTPASASTSVSPGWRSRAPEKTMMASASSSWRGSRVAKAADCHLPT